MEQAFPASLGHVMVSVAAPCAGAFQVPLHPVNIVVPMVRVAPVKAPLPSTSMVPEMPEPAPALAGLLVRSCTQLPMLWGVAHSLALSSTSAQLPEIV